MEEAEEKKEEEEDDDIASQGLKVSVSECRRRSCCVSKRSHVG
jgi:hypothetical protein